MDNIPNDRALLDLNELPKERRRTNAPSTPSAFSEPAGSSSIGSIKYSQAGHTSRTANGVQQHAEIANSNGDYDATARTQQRLEELEQAIASIAAGRGLNQTREEAPPSYSPAL